MESVAVDDLEMWLWTAEATGEVRKGRKQVRRQVWKQKTRKKNKMKTILTRMV